MVLPRLALWLMAANPYLMEGKALYEKMRYPAAEARLRTAAEVPTSTPDEVRELYDLLARAVVAQGRVAEAEGIYAELLAKDAHVPAPLRVSPKITEAFLRAKRRVYPDDFVRWKRLPSPPDRLELEVVDPWEKVARVVLQGAVSEGAFEERALRGQGRRYSAALSAARGETLRYYLEARDAQGKVLDRLGSEDRPLVYTNAEATFAAPPSAVSTAEVPSGPSRWPLYLTGGAAAVLVGVGTVLALGASRDHRAIRDDTDARTTRALNASAQSKAVGANAAFAGALIAGAGCFAVGWSW